MSGFTSDIGAVDEKRISVNIQINHLISQSNDSSNASVVNVSVGEREGVAGLRNGITSLPQFKDLSSPFILLDQQGREISTDSHWQDHYSQSHGKEISVIVLISPSPSLSPPITTICSRLLFPETPLLQPHYRFADSDLQSIPLCLCCMRMFDPSLLHNTSVPILGQEKVFQCNSGMLIDMGFAGEEVQAGYERDRARVKPFKPTTTATCVSESLDSPISLYLQREYYREMLKQSQSLSHSNEERERLTQFSRRLDSGIQTRLTWEDSEQQRIAREEINYSKILHYYEEEVESRNNTLDEVSTSVDSKSDEELILIAILKWFKRDFFSWCNKPYCQNDAHCDGRPGDMQNLGYGTPTDEERLTGNAGRVELYMCQKCHQQTRFPRYNNPAFMMKSRLNRRGRCGEFANVFGLVLRALGMDVGYILDFTDHVWVEVYMPNWGRYIHIDPCERAYDSPLMYETGWKKSLSHILSFTPSIVYGVIDVSARYTRQYPVIVSKRESEYCNEGLAQSAITDKSLSLSTLSPTRNMIVRDWDARTFVARLRRGREGFADVNVNTNPIGIVSREMYKRRRENAMREIEGLRMLRSIGGLKEAETQGRTSGDIEWRRQRGEIEREGVEAQGERVAGCDARTMTCTTGERVEGEREKRESVLTKAIHFILTSSKWKHMLPYISPSLSPSVTRTHRVCSLSLPNHGYIDLLLAFDSPSGVKCENKRILSSSLQSPFGLTSRLVIDDSLSLPLCKNAYTMAIVEGSGGLTWSASLSLSPHRLVQCMGEREGGSHSEEVLVVVYVHHDTQSVFTDMIQSLVSELSLSPIDSESLSRISEGRDLWVFLSLSPLTGRVTLLSTSSPWGVQGSNGYSSPSLHRLSPSLSPCAIRLRVSLSPSPTLSPSRYERVNDCAVVGADVLAIVNISGERDSDDIALEREARDTLSRYHSAGVCAGVTVFPKSTDRPSALLVYGGERVIQTVERVGTFSLLPICSTLSNQPNWSIIDSRLYYYCGGGDHGDTLYFDSSESVPFGERLRDITLYGGK